MVVNLFEKSPVQHDDDVVWNICVYVYMCVNVFVCINIASNCISADGNDEQQRQCDSMM